MASIQNVTTATCAIPWDLLAQETARDPSLSHVLHDAIYAEDGVLLYDDPVIIPNSLRNQVLHHLHAAHQGTLTMEQRAHAVVYWPGMSKDIQEIRQACAECNRNAPSQAVLPPLPSQPPSTPFEAIFADFFDHASHHYLVVGDRLSGWVEVFSSTAGSNLGGSAGLIRHLRTLFTTFGVPDELSSDGGPEFTSSSTESFLRTWNVRHRISSVSFPQSNGRAEVAVKTAKRLLRSNTGPTGNLDNDAFICAMLQLRNTPDPDCNLSPAQILFGRPLRDSLSFVNRLEKFSNPHIRPLWRDAWEAKENALRTRITRTTERLTKHTRDLQPLVIGDRVFIQNQRGPDPTKWDRSGLVIESLDNDQYRVKVDGSGRLTLRNRRFLRAYKPVSTSLQPPSVTRKPPIPSSQGQTLTHIPVNSQPPTKLHPPTEIEPSKSADAATTIPAANFPIQDLIPTESWTPTDPTWNRPTIEEERRRKAATTDEELQRPQQVSQCRPARARRPPKRFEPESGTWVEQ